MKPTTITVYLSKGGVGKSTVVQLLGLYLTSLGYNVAILDLDSQGGQSAIFDLLDDQGRNAETLHMVLKRELAIAAALRPVDPAAVPVFPGVEPGVLFLVEGGAQTQEAIGRVLSEPKRYRTTLTELFSRPITELGGRVDYVLIDMGPSDQVTAFGALVATDWLLIPTTSDLMSVQRVMAVLEEAGVARDYNPDLRVLGLLPTMTMYYFGGLRVSRNVKRGREMMEELHSDLLFYDRKGKIVELPYSEHWNAARLAGTHVLNPDAETIAQHDALNALRAIAARLGLDRALEVDLEKLSYV